MNSQGLSTLSLILANLPPPVLILFIVFKDACHWIVPGVVQIGSTHIVVACSDGDCASVLGDRRGDEYSPPPLIIFASFIYE